MYNNSYNDQFSYRPPVFPQYKGLLSSQAICSVFAGCADFESRHISIGLGSMSVTLCWLDGIVSGDSLGEDIIRPLTEIFRSMFAENEPAAFELMLNGGIFSYSVKARSTMDDTISDITHGSCAVVFDNLNAALTFEVRSSKARSVSEPTLEKSLKGAKDSFIETLRVNTALVRRRICSPELKSFEITIGRRTHTKVSILYIDGVVDPSLPKVLSERLRAIDVDSLLSTGTLEEYIVDFPLSPLPQMIHTERPDRFAMYLCDGRVGLLVDGLPLGLILPVTFAEFMKVTGDSSNHFLVATALTVLRYVGLILGLFLPALYVAIAMYHQEMIPTKLLISIIEAKQDVPFSTGFEILGMLLAFGFLQEAGLRLPNPIGDTVSIIGALIVGQSAVEARVVSPIAIIVVAVSAIACYTLPSQDLGSAVRLTAPFFVMVRNLVFFRTVERVEALIVALWIFPDFLLVTVMLLVAQSCLRPVFGFRVSFSGGRISDLSDGRFIIWLCSAAAVIIGIFIAPDRQSMELWSEKLIPYSNMLYCFILIPAVAIVAGKWRRKPSK